MQEELSRVVLRKVIRSDNANQANLCDNVRLEKEYNERLRAVDLESWYNSIESFTFPTGFVEISIDEAESMIKCYKAIKESKCSVDECIEKFLPIRDRVQDEMNRRGFSCVFAKLSSKSPKDSRICRENAKAVAQRELEEIQRDRELTPNDLVKVIMNSEIRALKMDSAAQILKAFLTSERVCEDDLPLALQFKNRWSQHIVIRKWVEIPMQFEFRTFVFGNKLTAISQYFDDAYFPELIENKEIVQNLIQELYASVKDRVNLQIKEYIMDVAVSLCERKAYVIELNPFGKPNGLGTGTVLFDNSNEHDLSILFGDSSFEFRIETKPYTGKISEFIRGDWNQFLKKNDFFGL